MARRNFHIGMLALMGAGLLVLACGCASIKRHWPSKAQWQDAAGQALRHPGTWVPAAGAAVIALGNWDKTISDWAREKTPVFGSSQNAHENSDRFRLYAQTGMILSALSVHIHDEHYWLPTTKRLAWGQFSGYAADSVRTGIKKITDRTRPSGGQEAFPSGHSSMAFAYVGMTYRNIDELNLNPVWQYSAKCLATALGYTTAWSRVEAGAHYPTDVLGGAALGNFIAIFLYDAFLDKDFILHLGFGTGGRIELSFQQRF